MRTIYLFMLTIAICYGAEGGPEVVSQDAEVTLGKHDTVSFNVVGFSAKLTPMASMMYAYEKEKDAALIFLSLSESVNTENALYGLFGLALVRSEKFAERAKDISTRKGMVDFGPGGCVVMQWPISKVVEWIEAERLKLQQSK